MHKEWFKLSNKKLKHLFRYYIVLFLIGIVISVLSLLFETININWTVTGVALLGGCGCALIGSTIFYLRKLYKSCINIEFSEPIDDDDSKKEIGVYYYYYLRPYFSIGFSIFIHVTLKASVAIISVKESVLSNGFIYLVMFFSFFGGFASGDLLTLIEAKSKDVVSKLVKEK